MAVLPNSPGTFSYNGISFVALYKSKVEVKPVKDSAGRALVAREYTIDVEGRIGFSDGILSGVAVSNAGAATSTDATLASMRLALEKPAGALVYTGKGFGPLQVNVPGGQIWDAAYGPWPDVLSWDPVGNNQGCLVRWKCTTMVPCEENPAEFGVLEFCWSESWDIDADGYTTRTINGHLTIAATRQQVNSRSIQDNADAFLERVVPDLPTGFRRTQNRSLSEDKRTLEFQIKDEEMPQPLPSGVSSFEAHHRVSFRSPVGQGKGSANLHTHTISGTVTLPARTPKQFAFEKILLLLQSRWGDMGAGISAKLNGLTYFLESIELDDDIFGRSTSFSATVKVVGGIFPFLLLEASGLWSPIPGTDFVRWKQSIFGKSGRAMGPRGVAGMKFQNQDDAIVDLCSRGAIITCNGNNPGRSLVGKGQLLRQLNGIALNPMTTWLNYRLRLRLLENDRIARHKPLGLGKLEAVPVEETILDTDLTASANLVPPNPLSGNVGRLVRDTEQGIAIGTIEAGYTGGPAVGELTQQVSAPLYTLRLEGGAIRIGYPIPVPRLASIGGQDVVQLRQNVLQEQVSSIGGVPVYAAQWLIDYAQEGWIDPEAYGIPGNPAVPVF